MEFPFERKAMRGDPLPAGLDIADSCLYISLKNLYARYYEKKISRKEAQQEKSRLVFNWRTDKSKIVFLDRDCQELKNKIGAASDEYAKNPCIETADNLYAAIYNLPTNWREQK